MLDCSYQLSKKKKKRILFFTSCFPPILLMFMNIDSGTDEIEVYDV
jgi:hypothetical protein